MYAKVAEMSKGAEGRPDTEVAGDEKNNEERGAGSPPDETLEEEHQRQAAGQHHGHRHEAPATYEEEGVGEIPAVR